MLTFERWVCSHLRAVRNRDGFTFALFRFADDVYSSEDFLLQAQVELFNFHTRWKVWAVLKVFFCQDLLDSTTDATDRLNLEFFTGELKTFIDGFPFHGFYFPVSYLEGVQVMKNTNIAQLSTPKMIPCAWQPSLSQPGE